MEGLRISGCGLACGVLCLGAGRLYGIEDPFLGMTPREAKNAIRSAQAEMDRKGYGVLNLNGDFTLSEEAEELFQAAAFPDACLRMESGRRNEAARRQVIYIKEGKLVRLTESEDGLFLEPVTEEEGIRGMMKTAGFGAGDGEKAPEHAASFSEPGKPLAESGKSLAESGGPLSVAGEALKKASDAVSQGKEKEAEEILAESWGQKDSWRPMLEELTGRADAAMAVLWSFRPGYVKSLIAVRGTKDAILMEASGRLSENWLVSEGTAAALREKLSGWVLAGKEQKEDVADGS